MATYGEISWEDDSDSGSGAGTKNDKDIWLRLGEGKNVVRLVTKPHQYIVHKAVKKASDKKGFGQKVYCSNPDGKGSCPLCDQGLKASRRWLLGVIDSKSQYKILDISWQVYSAIKNLAKDDVWGDPTKYDINIFVNKQGGPTGYYSVQPIPHKPLSPDGMKARDGADLEELKKKIMPPTTEAVQKRIDKLLEGEPAAKPAPKPGASQAPATSNGRTIPQISDDEENVDDIFPSYDNNA
ncbi:unnamed protein product [Sphagnum balticum]